MHDQLIKGEQLSFYKLIADKKINIEIPIIQRDYAQGRESVTEIRNDFLNALYGYLNDGNISHDLDFIYGDIDTKDNLIPLDGQQRLTTLFLLHWYLSILDGSYEDFKQIAYANGNSKFTYKTRTSSFDFCNTLLNKGLDLNKLLPPDSGKQNAVSKTIKDCHWYFISWDRDATIQSMLIMLDSIHEKFKHHKGLYKKLTDPENPAVTFRFIPLKSYGLTDDLYIKMNSRGKPLTRFENFKAKFEQNLPSNEVNTKFCKKNIKSYFAKQIDTKWTDLFWHYRIKKVSKLPDEKEKLSFEIDSLMMNLIATIAINHTALNQSNENVRQLILNQETLPLSFFTGLDSDFVNILTTVLDIFSDSNKGLKTFLKDNSYYNEQESFINIIKRNFSDVAYWERIQFYAYYSYLVENSGKADGLADWMRIITNLSSNTMPYNNDTEFVNSLKAIKEWLPQSNRILEYFKTKDPLKTKGFDSVQIREEHIKACLITKNDQWRACILEYEKQKYFKGQLTFALAFSGIESSIDTIENWTVEENDTFYNSFNSYISKVFSLFDDTGLNDLALKNHRLHRALLSKGNYLIYGRSNFSFLNDSDRDVSWKRFLQADNDDRRAKRDFFKTLIDDSSFDENNLKSLESIAKKFDPDIEPWRVCFIKYPEIFNDLGNFKYIRYESEHKIYLLRSLRMSAEHSELYSRCLYYQLKNEPFFSNPIPFKEFQYYSISGDDDVPCAFLNNWHIEKHNFALDIIYVGENKYKLLFVDRNSRKIQEKLILFLSKKGFNREGNRFEVVISSTEVKDFIITFCKKVVLSF